MLRRLSLILVACLAAESARAEFLLVPEAGTVSSGGSVAVTLFVPNDSSEERTVALPSRLTLRPAGGGPDVVLEATEPVETPVHIAPGAFHRAHYSGPLPENLRGDIVLEPVDFEGPPLVIHAARAAAPSAATRMPPATDGTAPDPDTARFVSAFSPYEPNYFSAGSSGPTNAKFQISLKFRLFNPNTKTPFLEKLYLGYSQTSIWDLTADSKPFLDSSYRPTLFFLDNDVSQWPFQGSKLGFQGGVEHESNGKAGADSRSVNILYVRPTFLFPLQDNYFVSVAPKVYAYLDKSDNPDMPDYRGYTDLLIKVGETDGLQLASTLRKGTNRDAYSAELDLSYPLKRPTFGNLGGYLHLQYFEGYGESLLDYNRHVRPQFRIGLMITR